MATNGRLPQHLSLSVTTDASGDWTETTGAYRGTLRQIRYDNTDLAATTDLTVVGATTGTTYLSQANNSTDKTFYPLAQAHNSADGTNAADPALVPHVFDEALVVTIDEGGATNTATITIVFE